MHNIFEAVQKLVNSLKFESTYCTFNVVFIELVALLHCAEAGVLPDSPRSVGVHGGIGPSSVGKHSWQFVCSAS